MHNLNKEKFICTGCCLCHDVCPVNAIQMIEDNEGFLTYKIDEEKCTNCGLCVKKCPKLNEIKKINKIKKCYGAYSKNKDILKNSSSGGIFSELANHILDNNGVVVGAVWQDYQIKHIIIDKKEDLDLLRGSKYLQSNLQDIFKQIKKQLDKEKLVLFSGTSCHIAAINNFIKHQNLITIDIVCHGVPSKKIFDESLQQRFKNKNIEVNFRNKDNGWSDFNLEYKNNKTINHQKDGWFLKFLDNHFLKKDCYNCPFISKERLSDISLGDFWGIQRIDKDFFENNNNTGISVVLINSEKGEKLFNEINNNIIYKEYDVEIASNSSNPRILNGKYDEKFIEKRQEFFKQYQNNKIKFKNQTKINELKTLIKRVLRKIKRTINRR